MSNPLPCQSEFPDVTENLRLGREASKNFLMENPEIMKEIEMTVRSLAEEDLSSGAFDPDEADIDDSE
ncbi:MAG TPA: hypothetical protein PLW19_07145 [Anaerolineaceae bacterium]|nr:hypothetical protein [Anaerolineaceae bacterium]